MRLILEEETSTGLPETVADMEKRVWPFRSGRSRRKSRPEVCGSRKASVMSVEQFAARVMSASRRQMKEGEAALLVELRVQVGAVNAAAGTTTRRKRTRASGAGRTTRGGERRLREACRTIRMGRESWGMNRSNDDRSGRRRQEGGRKKRLNPLQENGLRDRRDLFVHLTKKFEIFLAISRCGTVHF